jgi:CBS domain-containing protein
MIGVGRQMSPAAKLGDVMSHPVQVATPGQRLAEIDAFFATQQFSGLPVVDKGGVCVGVVSKKDKAKAPNGVSCRSYSSLPPRRSL